MEHDEYLELVLALKADRKTDFQLDKLSDEGKNMTALERAAKARFDSQGFLERHHQAGVMVLGKWTDQYPRRLKEIPGSPWILFAKGNTELLDQASVAIVGSRDASAKGFENARKITQLSVSKGLVTISGLAIGIDTVVGLETLKNRGKHLAVLPSSLDNIYPKQNNVLARDVLERGGLLLSEHPLGADLQKSYFVARNRIVVGLGEILVVVEAGLRSGSTSSATWAAEMGREVYVFPGSPGNDQLLREGAKKISL